MLTKERPHLTRGVDAVACRPDDPFRQRLAARPGVASSLDRIEHHGRTFSTVRVFEADDIRSDSGFDGVRSAPVSSRPIRRPIPNGRKLQGVERIARWPAL